VLPGTLVNNGDIAKHPIIDYSEAQRTAWHTMQEEFAGNVSLINFIYELKDFREIAKFMSKMPIKKIGNTIRRTLNRMRRDPVVKSYWNLTKPVAELHLTEEFAIKPLIKDLLAIGETLEKTVRDAQDKFELKGLDDNSRHYTELMSQTGTIAGIYSKYYQYGSLSETTFNATLKYTYQYTKRSTIDALRHYWGMNLTGEALWNMIPFSFLVDYVLGVGQAISLMEHDENVHTNITQYAESFLTTKSYGYHLNTALSPSPVLIDFNFATGKRLISGTESTLYTRRVTVPNQGAVLPRIRKPSFKQATNATALLRCFL
jgi:hypothetical protein